jgi:RecA/RadA recombinase
MAKRKNEEVLENKDESKILDDAMSALEKLNPDATELSEESLSNVNDWIDTGCYSLNAIISGSVYRGIPVGRITGLVGLSGTGKTLIMNKIMANAIKKKYKAIYFDSENALDKMTAERLGCDVTQIKHCPVELIEDCKSQIITFLTKLIEAGLKRKVAIFIDSLGNLVTRKEIEDSLENKSATDMGSKAKLLGSLIRQATGRVAKAEVPMVFSNHIYEIPTQMYPTLVKTQSGGLKTNYLPSVLLQLSTTTEKIEDESDPTSALSEKVSGVNLRAMTTKNRFAPPFIETTMKLNYKTGLSRYIGLLNMAKAYGMIEKDGHAYAMEGTKIGYASSFEDNAEFWENGPLSKLDELIKKDLTYSNENLQLLKNEAEKI